MGKRKFFTLEFNFAGALFQKKNVWAEFAKITYGATTCYAYIAQKIRHPQAIWSVVTAIDNNEITIIAPCHRVLDKNNALHGYRGWL